MINFPTPTKQQIAESWLCYSTRQLSWSDVSKLKDKEKNIFVHIKIDKVDEFVRKIRDSNIVNEEDWNYSRIPDKVDGIVIYAHLVEKLKSLF